MIWNVLNKILQLLIRLLSTVSWSCDDYSLLGVKRYTDLIYTCLKALQLRLPALTLRPKNTFSQQQWKAAHQIRRMELKRKPNKGPLRGRSSLLFFLLLLAQRWDLSVCSPKENHKSTFKWKTLKLSVWTGGKFADHIPQRFNVSCIYTDPVTSSATLRLNDFIPYSSFQFLQQQIF